MLDRNARGGSIDPKCWTGMPGEEVEISVTAFWLRVSERVY